MVQLEWIVAYSIIRSWYGGSTERECFDTICQYHSSFITLRWMGLTQEDFWKTCKEKSIIWNSQIGIWEENWDEENRFDLILPDYLKHITDEKPITARQCVKALAQVGLARPQYIPQILSALRSADLSKYKDSMRPLIERDMEETEKILMNSTLSTCFRNRNNTLTCSLAREK